mmetsp:Transcript_83200/g.166469  ORF Transcript_83200/g.166469 Transcript_83200/m.166469 type:complete len:80 (-) Transcript_83200:388-627(-)
MNRESSMKRLLTLHLNGANCVRGEMSSKQSMDTMHGPGCLSGKMQFLLVTKNGQRTSHRQQRTHLNARFVMNYSSGLSY